MSDRALVPDQQRLEARLRSVAADVAWPATPDLRAGVLASIASREAAARPRRLGTRGPLVRALVLALLALVALAGIAAALGFRLPGIEISFTGRTPAPAATRVAGEPVDEAIVLIGSPVPLAEARDGEPPRVLVPAGLPEPATAFVDGTGDRRLVTLAWRAVDGGPAIAGTDFGLVLTAAPGRIEEPLLRKVLGPGTTIEAVEVGGARGWWIGGAAHELFIAGPDDDPTLLRTRLAGDTLVFAREGTVYRLESALGRDATIAIAESLR